MKITKISEISYDDYIYTPQVEDNENYLMENDVLSKNCQNISKKTAQLILSRIDKTCKVVITGSNKQIDNPYINKFNNGLTTLVNATEFEHSEVNLFATKLSKVVRGPITEFAERVFS